MPADEPRSAADESTAAPVTTSPKLPGRRKRWVGLGAAMLVGSVLALIVAVPLADDTGDVDRARAGLASAQARAAQLSSALVDERSHGGQVERDLSEAVASGSRAVRQARASAEAQAAENVARSAELDDREQAVVARESAATTAEQEAARNTFGEGLSRIHRGAVV